MKFAPVVFFLLLMSGVHSHAQYNKVILWQRTLGGFRNDSLVSIQPTKDNGFIVSGFSNSDISSNKTANALEGSYDFWIIKLNSNGDVQWDKTIGGLGDDTNPYIIQTKDGGFLVGGKSASDISGFKTENAINKSSDYWVIKTDSNGNIEWNNTIGGIQMDDVSSIANVPGANAGYMIAGYSHSGYGFDKKEDNRGSNLWADYWIVKLSAAGKVQWQKVYGGKNDDMLSCMQVTKDSGYLFGGSSYSPSGFEKADSFLGNNDFWIVKTSAEGIRQWDKVIGGSLSDYQTAVTLTPDGGFLAAGYSNSPQSYDKSGNGKGGMDYWIVKIDGNGNYLWDKTYGGSKSDYLTSVQTTADNGFIFGGYSRSGLSGDKTEDARGLEDIWIVKTDSAGNMQWDKTLGGTGSDRLSMIKEIAADEYIIGGTSNSPLSGDKDAETIGNTGFNDFWIIRLSSANPDKDQAVYNNRFSDVVRESTSVNTDIRKLTIQATPNPAKGVVRLYFGGLADKKISLMVYNNSGKTILKTALSSGTNNYSVDLSKQAAGIYYAVISAGSSSATTIIIRE